MKRSKPITEDTTFNMENPSNTEGKNYGRHPANLHYIECGYRMPEIYNALSLIPNGGLQEEYKGVNPNSYRGSFAPHTPRCPLATGLHYAPSEVGFYTCTNEFGS